MAEPSASESSAGTDSDQDFDPSAEMLVNDFDDEHTLDEEEALGDEDLTNSNEISELTKEQDIPIEVLLQMYGYNNQNKISTTENNTEKHETTESSDSSNTSTAPPSASQQQSSSSASANIQPRSSATLNISDCSENDSDDESTNEDEWRRTIQVGSDYQAVITEGFKHYDDKMVTEDRLLWKPSASLNDANIDKFLFEYAKMCLSEEESNYGDFILPYGSHIKDDEQALYLLMQARYNMKESLKMHENGTEPKAPISEQITPWTEDECRAFENGLRTFGKDFFQIKHHRVPTRSVGEVVTFYYFWKKTERHDSFVNKFRIEKKKYALHPGTTDYMDRFAEEQDNITLNYQNCQMTGASSSVHSASQNLLSNSNATNRPFHADNTTTNSSSTNTNHHISINQPNNRQSSMHHNHNTAQSSTRNNSTSDGFSSGPTVTISGNQKRTINVTTTGEPQTILINDSDFTRPTNNDKQIVVCTGSSNTTTIVVGKNPVVIDGTWVSSSSTGLPSASSSTTPTNFNSKPSVSIYKIPNSSAFNR